MDNWDKSRLKYWLDVISNVALVWCGAVVFAILAGIDLEVIF